MLMLRVITGAAFLKLYYSSFGCLYHKPTGFLHCVLGLDVLHRDEPEFLAEVVLRGQIWWEGALIF